MISNCSTPTAPRMGSRSTRWRSKNSCTAPSSDSCSSPFFSCLRFSGSSRRTRTKCSGENRGMPSNSTGGPWHRLSPMRRTPGSQTPRMSPENASSTRVRSWAMNCTGRVSDRVLPVRTCCTSMPRLNLPEQMRMKAMRSRCWGSMFAWILNTKPEKSGSSASSGPMRGGAGARRLGQIDELVQERLQAEVVHGAAEEHRRHLPAAEALGVEGVAGGLQQLDLFAGAGQRGRAQRLGQLGIVPVDLAPSAPGARPRRPAVRSAAACRPSDRRRPTKAVPCPSGQLAGLQGTPSTRSISSIRSKGSLPTRSILLMKVTMGMPAHPADLEQLDGLRLDPLHAVDQHDGGVGGGQRAVGVLGEVVVAGGVQQVHAPAGVFELQHAAGHRDAALALDVHPVAGDGAAAALALDRAGQVQGAAVEQELLGERGLARVGVRDDGEGSARGDLGAHPLQLWVHGRTWSETDKVTIFLPTR